MVWSDPDVEHLPNGVHRLPLPLPGDGLKAINVYVLEGDEGVTLVDAGWDTPAAWEGLGEGLRGAGFDVRDVRHVLVTHIHADHIGQSTRIHRHAGARVWLGEGERTGFETLARDFGETVGEQLDHLEESGAAELVEQLRARPMVATLEWDQPHAWVRDRDTVPGGRNGLEAVHTPGHTQGHLSFLDRSARTLLSGDHLLPHITPSIGFEPHPTSTALADFLSSLAKVRNLPVDVVLPAHGPVFTDVPARVDALAAHHDVRLRDSLAALPEAGGTPFVVAQRLGWTRRQRTFAELDVFNRMLAVWETRAHLDLLASQGRVTRVDVDGVATFCPPTSRPS